MKPPEAPKGRAKGCISCVSDVLGGGVPYSGMCQPLAAGCSGVWCSGQGWSLEKGACMSPWQPLSQHPGSPWKGHLGITVFATLPLSAKLGCENSVLR